MPTGKVTKSAVENIVAGARVQFLWDPELRGFGLKTEPSGAKSYVVQYRIGGRGSKVRRYTIGRHGSPWTPSTARTEAERLLRLVGQGIDVLEAKREKARKAQDLGFTAYSQRFVDRCLKERWGASWKDAESKLKRLAVPVLKDKALPEITRSDLNAVLDRVRGKAATRRNLYAILRRLFRWAVSEGDLERSPLEGMEPPPLPQSRDRVLEDWEVRLVLGAAAKEAGAFAPLVQMLVLTGQRLEELAAAHWHELDRDDAMLRIPADRAKNRRATEVPLSPSVLAVLDAWAGGAKWPRRGLVFTTTGRTPISGFSRAKRRLDREIAKIAGDEKEDRPVNGWRYHDLRRTVATGLQRLDVRFEVTEAILNHVGTARSGVAGVYQRHDWKAEKRAALNAWAAHVEQVLGAMSASNVVHLRRPA